MAHQILKNNDEVIEIIAHQLVFFHLEQMSDNYWWAMVETPETSIHLNFGVEDNRLNFGTEVKCEAMSPVIDLIKDKPLHQKYKTTADDWEIRNNDDGTLDEIVACHPKRVTFKRDWNSWILEVDTKHRSNIVVRFKSSKPILPIQLTADADPNTTEHRCVLCHKREK